MGTVLESKPCPECSRTGQGSSCKVYEDGEYCHECGYGDRSGGKPVEKVEAPKKKLLPLIAPGDYKAIRNRGISKGTAEKFKTSVAQYHGQTVICTSFYLGGAIVAQKLKFPKVELPNGKLKSKYIWLGDKSKVNPLWGMDLFEPNPKLSVTICEGELDMCSRSTLNADKWPVLSLLDGAGPQSLQGIAKAKEYLLGFKRIVLMFDGDKAGRETAEKAVEILGAKAKIVNMPDGMDVCAMVEAGRGDEINRLEMTAVGHRPKDIVTVADYTDEELYSADSRGVDIPYPRLNALLRGLKPASLYMFCAGSGLGKSTVVKELSMYLMFQKQIKVGCVFLEQGDKEAMRDFIAMDNNIEAETFSQNPECLSKEVRDASRAKLEEAGFFLKHFGSLDSTSLVSKIEFMMIGCDCQFVILDHISMVVSGTATSNERKDLDLLMTRLRTVIQATGKSVIAISHLKRPPGDGADFNNGKQVNLSDLRGSAAIEQISDYVVALERDQFSETCSDQIRLKVLKCRRGGRIGYADKLSYSHDTGRLSVIPDNPLPTGLINNNVEEQ